MKSALLGFSDFFDEVGAVKAPGAKPPAKTVSKNTGKGPVPLKPYPKPKKTTGMVNHAKVLDHAHSVLLKAGKTLGRTQIALAKKPVAKLPVTAKPTTTAKAVPASVAHNVAKITGKNVVLGAAVAAKLSPKAMRAVQIHNDAVVKAKKAAQVLAQHALKTKKSVQTLAKHMVNQKKAATLLRTPLSKKPASAVKTHVGELLADPIIGEQVAEMLGEYYEEVGATPDPANPGFLTDGTPDPAAGGVATAPGGSTDANGISPGQPGYDPTTDPMSPQNAASSVPPLSDGSGASDILDTVAAVTGTPAPGMDSIIPDMTAPGVAGIAYDGSKGSPDGYAGTYNLFTRALDDREQGHSAAIDGTNHFGYVWGSFDEQGAAPGGLPWGGNFQTQSWNKINGYHNTGLGPDWHWAASVQDAAASPTMVAHGVQYGPIVGNPGMKDFAAMRMDAQGNLFWFPQEAPDWLLAPLKQAAAITAAAATKAAAAAAAADAAAQAKTAADNAAAQAAQDAANALSESQAASQAKIDQGAAETAAQQQIVTQAQADTDAQNVETEQTKQAGGILIQQAQQQVDQDKQTTDLLIQQAKQEQSYYAAHPELDPSAAMATDDGSGGDAGGDAGGDDDSGGGDDGGDDSDQLTDDDAAAFNEGNEDVDIDYSADF